MKKSELRAGMVAQFKSGGFYRVITNTAEGDILIGKDEWERLRNYNEDLTCKYSDFDIVKVYAPQLYLLKDDHLQNIDNPAFAQHSNLIWDKNTKEMTIKEVEEKLGYKIKIVEKK